MTQKKYRVTKPFTAVHCDSGTPRPLAPGLEVFAFEPLGDPVQFEIDLALHEVGRAVFSANCLRT